jgi:hypothetical protein
VKEKTMRDEEIIAVRKVRHEISAECGHDVHKVAAYYRAVGERLRQAGKASSRNNANQNLPKGHETRRK